jgi:putative transcriptional regulator
MKRWWFLFAALLSGTLGAQANAIVLVAKPGLADPNFSETVLVVTRAPDASTVGVILNRATEQRHFGHRLFAGGPVMREVVVAMFAAAEAPKEAAFQLLPDVYLTLHPKNIEALRENPGERMRLFAGFAGWAPRQLEAEIDSGAWYALRASASLLFRKDTSGMWGELVQQARGARAGNYSVTPVADGSISAPETSDILGP